MISVFLRCTQLHSNEVDYPQVINVKRSLLELQVFKRKKVKEVSWTTNANIQ